MSMDHYSKTFLSVFNENCIAVITVVSTISNPATCLLSQLEERRKSSLRLNLYGNVLVREHWASHASRIVSSSPSTRTDCRSRYVFHWTISDNRESQVLCFQQFEILDVTYRRIHINKLLQSRLWTKVPMPTHLYDTSI